MKWRFRRKLLGGLLLTASINKHAVAQTNSSYSQIIPPSPTSVQFQRYGDYPVSYFTGLPDITIPIYTIKVGDITVPITLSYHASGTRADDVSGLVGLGWSLNTGGMITRTINGLPDDGGRAMNIPLHGAAGVDVAQINGIYDMENLENGVYDYEYDMYSYNFLGKSGKYINYSPHQNGQPFVFQKSSNLLFNNLYSITDEDGLNYSFGASATESTEYLDNFGGTQSPITTWHLSAIQSSLHPDIFVGYSYQAGQPYVYYAPGDRYILDDFFTDVYQGISVLDYQYSASNCGICIVPGSTLIKNYPKVIREIDFNNGKMIFNLDAHKMLNSIDIYDNNNALTKRVTLHVIPFATTRTLDSYSNYGLQSVMMKDMANNTVENYSFDYNSQNSVDAKPPALVGSAGKDYWGFYNGDDGRITDLSWYPKLTTREAVNESTYQMTTPIFPLANRNPNEIHTKTYVLNKITYPTGGYSTFDFELNRTSLNGPMGGLRIKTISNYLSDGTIATQKNYTYQMEYAEVIPTNESYASTIVGNMAGISDCYFRRLTIADNSSIDFMPQGSSVVYPIVSETDGNITSRYTYDYGNAFTYQTLDQGQVYDFLGRYIGDGVPQYPKQITNYYKPWNFGNLLEKAVFGSNYVESVTNQYEEVVTDTARDFILQRALALVNPVTPNTNPNYTPMSPQAFDIGNGYYHQGPWNFADHFYLSGGKRLKSTTTIYQGLTTTRDYSYDNTAYPFIASRVLTNNSKNQVISTAMKHPFDYPTTPVYGDMTSYNLINPVIEQIDSNRTLGKQISKSVTNYNYYPQVSVTNLTYPSGNSGYIGPQTIQSSFGGHTPETDITVDLYTTHGNVQQITARKGIVTTYLYGYNSLYPVAKIVGRDYAAVSPYITQSLLNNPADDASLRTYLGRLRTIFPNTQVSTYTYTPLVGMTSATDPKGQTTYYEYDSAQRLKTVKDQNGKILKQNDYHYKL